MKTFSDFDHDGESSFLVIFMTAEDGHFSPTFKSMAKVSRMGECRNKRALVQFKDSPQELCKVDAVMLSLRWSIGRPHEIMM